MAGAVSHPGDRCQTIGSLARGETICTPRLYLRVPIVGGATETLLSSSGDLVIVAFNVAPFRMTNNPFVQAV